jgi:hypothetical protein
MRNAVPLTFIIVVDVHTRLQGDRKIGVVFVTANGAGVIATWSARKWRRLDSELEDDFLEFLAADHETLLVEHCVFVDNAKTRLTSRLEGHARHQWPFAIVAKWSIIPADGGGGWLIPFLQRYLAHVQRQ